MEEQLKSYETPQCEVLEMELQGMIAMSGGDDIPETPWSPS